MVANAYLLENRQALEDINYLTLPDRQVSLYTFFGSLPEDYLKILDLKKYTPDQLAGIYRKLESIDSGGFGHGAVSSSYNHYRLHPRYVNTRDTGVVNLLNILAHNKDMNSQTVIIDFLAGSGYLAKKLKQYWKNSAPPQVYGIDVSSSMVQQAEVNNEVVFRSYHGGHLFRNASADLAISCYGTHHIPEVERDNFVESAYAVLKDGGKFILHDFEELTPTARWYSDIIHKYRLCGHPYKHFRSDELRSLLGKYFQQVDVLKIYDPFVLDGDDPARLKSEFFEYLIHFFSLEKLLGTLEDEQAWKAVADKLEETFTFDKNDLTGLIQNSAEPGNMFESEDIPIVSKITIFPRGEGSYRLVAPRVAIAGIGYKNAN